MANGNALPFQACFRQFLACFRKVKKHKDCRRASVSFGQKKALGFHVETQGLCSVQNLYVTIFRSGVHRHGNCCGVRGAWLH